MARTHLFATFTFQLIQVRGLLWKDFASSALEFLTMDLSSGASSLPLLRDLCLLLVLIAIIVSYYHMNFSRVGRYLNKFPGAPLFPFIGCAYMFLGPPECLKKTITSHLQKYGRRFRMWKLHNPYLMITDPKDVEVLLSSNVEINKGRDYNQLVWLNGHGLITSSGEMWREDRKLLNPSFKYQQYDGFLASFNKHGKILCDILSKHEFPLGDEVRNIHPALCKCTMDTVFESVLGTNINIQESLDSTMGNTLYKAAKDAMEAYRNRGLKPWLCFPLIRNLNGIAKKEQWIRTFFHEEMTKIIKEREEMFRLEGECREENRAFIDILLTEGRSYQNLVEHAFTIFAAGFETNATAMNFILFLLALNPSCQQKVHEELDRVFNGDNGRDASFHDLAELKYMEQCINETMRHFPPAPILTRNIKNDLTLPDGAVVPKGTDVVVFIYELNHDPEIYPSPHIFDPDRFLPKEIKGRHPFAFIPFSKGPRMCIGQKYAMMQMKAVLSHVLRKFKVSTNMKYDDVNIVYGAIIEIDCDIYLTLTPRGEGEGDNNNNNNCEKND